MRLIRYLWLAIFLAIPAIALAHGPTRQKIVLSVDVAAAARSGLGGDRQFPGHELASCGVFQHRRRRQRRSTPRGC